MVSPRHRNTSIHVEKPGYEEAGVQKRNWRGDLGLQIIVNRGLLSDNYIGVTMLMSTQPFTSCATFVKRLKHFEFHVTVCIRDQVVK